MMKVPTSNPYDYYTGETVCLLKRGCLQVKVKWVYSNYVFVRPLKWHEAVLFNIGRLLWEAD